MSDLKLEGKIIAIFEKQQVTDSFAKREFVIETDEQYPQTVKFEFAQDKCSELDGFSLNDVVDVHFNVQGRKWTNKEGKDVYFATLKAWRIVRVSSGANNIPPMEETPNFEETGGSELPF